MLVNAIKGGNQPSVTVCDRFTKIGLMRFTGNQWNEHWSWERETLDAMSDDDLTRLYRQLNPA